MPPWLYSTHSVFISADAGTAANMAVAATAADSMRSIVIEVLPELRKAWLTNFALRNFVRVSRRALAKSRGFANESQVSRGGSGHAQVTNLAQEMRGTADRGTRGPLIPGTKHGSQQRLQRGLSDRAPGAHSD